MTQSELKLFLQKPFARAEWLPILRATFRRVDIFAAPQQLFTDHQSVKNGGQFGSIQLDDGKNIALFEVEVADYIRIERNRVALRGIAARYIDQHISHGALVFYHSKTQPVYRFSFISKQSQFDEQGQLTTTETAPKRFTYLFGEGENTRTAASRLLSLQSLASRKMEDVLEAFSVEKIGDEFFKKYKAHYETLCQHLYKKPEAAQIFKADSPAAAQKLMRDFAKKLMGRLVFLYFLQKKRWLGCPADANDWQGGDPDFIRNLFEKSPNRARFHSRELARLFFKTLNERRPDDLFEMPDGSKTRVPYLNGGLFDDDLPEGNTLDFPETWFAEVFEFFSQYNFTIDENSPLDHEVGIDPEMLGHIFENLLEENRSRNGAFYTPKEVVHFMSQEAILRYLIKELKPATDDESLQIQAFVHSKHIGSFVRNKAAQIDKLLDAVKVCDPAIGSGAFPMGILQEIYDCKSWLYPALKTAKLFDPAQTKENIILRSIYGVDIDKGAIDIARLRFWLSIVVEIDEPRPLPNFDYKFMQGDSLREEFAGISLTNATVPTLKFQVHEPARNLFGELTAPQTSLFHQLPDDDECGAALVDIERELFHATPAEKERLLKCLDKKEKQFIADEINRLIDEENTRLANLEASLEHKIKATQKAEQQKIIRQKLDDARTKAAKTIAELRQKFADLERLNPYEKPWFLWHLYFADIFQQKGGFDIVIANPPYVRNNDYQAVRDRFGLGSNDLYGMFTALALDTLLRPGGTLAFITSDTWMTIGSHLALRKKLLAWQLLKVLRLPPDTFGATVNTCIFTLAKEPNPDFNAIQRAVALKNDPGDLFDVGHQLLAADLTNISRQKDTQEFADKLRHIEDFAGDYSARFAVYRYPQNLVFLNSNCPVFAASPRLFRLMNDTVCETENRPLGTGDEAKNIAVRKIEFNGKTLELVRFGDIADVKVGLQTGDNDYYLFQNPEARGNYKDINQFRQFLLTEEDLETIRADEAVRLKVIEKGIHETQDAAGFDADRWFGGRYIVPYDKGGESDADEGWLPNYFVPTNYFIDWSERAVRRLETYTIEQRIVEKEEGTAIKASYRTTAAAVIRNRPYYFKGGITYSPTGIYSPTCRLNGSGIFGNKGSTIFQTVEVLSTPALLGWLNFRLTRFLMKNYLSHTIEVPEGQMVELPLLLNLNDESESLVLKIVESQQANSQYDYFGNEQKALDELAYLAHGLTASDIQEIEYWWARRYPKLARYADLRPRRAGQEKRERAAALRAAIETWENRYTEFKTSMRPGAGGQSKVKNVRPEIIKTLASFLNSEGGTVFIGVAPDKRTVGLEHHDFTTISDSDKLDGWQRAFDDGIGAYLGNDAHGLLQLDFIEMDGLTVARVDVSASAKPIWFKNPDERDRSEFYIRRQASKVMLEGQQAVEYIRQHFV